MGLLIKTALQSPNISIFGTYTHAGWSYAATDGMGAAEILALEVAGANECGKRVLSIARELGLKEGESIDTGGLRLAVGATPTAHAAGAEWGAARENAGVARGKMVGRVEL